MKDKTGSNWFFRKLTMLAIGLFWHFTLMAQEVILGGSFVSTFQKITWIDNFSSNAGSPPPDVAFDNLGSFGYSIYFEKKSIAGFQWRFNIDRIFANHRIIFSSDGIMMQGPSYKPYYASFQFGYRKQLFSRISFAGFLGPLAAVHFPARFGIDSRMQVGNSYYISTNYLLGNSLYIASSVNALWEVSSQLYVSFDITALPIDINANGHLYTISSNQNGSNVNSRFNYELAPVLFKSGIVWKFIK